MRYWIISKNKTRSPGVQQGYIHKSIYTCLHYEQCAKNGAGETNIYLGEQYEFFHKEWHPEKFRAEWNQQHGDPSSKQDDIPDEVFGIVHSLEGKQQYLLRKSEWCFIMTSHGSTFANLSYKPTDK